MVQPVLPGFQPEAVWQRFDGRVDLWQRLLRSTAADCPEWCESLQSLATARAWPELQARVHTLRGLFANLGGQRIALAGALENALAGASTVANAAEVSQQAECGQWLQQLQEELQAFQAAVAGQAPAASEAGDPIQAGLTAEEWSRLFSCLHENEYPAPEMLDKLRALAGKSPELALALRCLDQFDYRGALEALAPWANVPAAE